MSNLLFGNIIKQLDKKEAILQIGCGTGNLGKLLLYSSYNYVRGVDIVDKIIKIAQHSVPTRYRSKFVKGFFDDKEVYDIKYDTVICSEVFEYSDCDLPILNSIKKGSKIIFTVPGFPNEAFPRYFLNEDTIKLRYSDIVDIKSIDSIIYNDDFCKLYLVNCIKK